MSTRSWKIKIKSLAKHFHWQKLCSFSFHSTRHNSLKAFNQSTKCHNRIRNIIVIATNYNFRESAFNTTAKQIIRLMQVFPQLEENSVNLSNNYERKLSAFTKYEEEEPWRFISVVCFMMYEGDGRLRDCEKGSKNETTFCYKNLTSRWRHFLNGDFLNDVNDIIIINSARHTQP